jgi:hypothetical protein
MNEMKRASRDEVPIAVCKRERHKNVPTTRETSLTTVEISRALTAIPGEFGAVLGRKILEKRIDCDQLLDLLNSVEAKAEEAVVTDVFCKHSHLFLPFLDRLSWNRLGSTNSQINKCNRSVSPPWPQKLLQVGSTVNAVAFSPDGECLACGCDDGMVRLWNKRNGSCTFLKVAQNMSAVFLFLPIGRFWHRVATTNRSVCGSLTTKATDFWKVTAEQ